MARCPVYVVEGFIHGIYTAPTCLISHLHGVCFTVSACGEGVALLFGYFASLRYTSSSAR